MIQIIDGFNLQTSTPIDSRIVVADENERDNITSTYHGLRVWQVDTNIPYFWNGTQWESELDLVVTGFGSINNVPKFKSSSPTEIEDSQISDDGAKVSIVGELYVGSKVEIGGVLDCELDAVKIKTGSLDLERLDKTGANDGDVLILDNSIPKWGSLSNISIGSSATTNKIKVDPIIINGEYRIILSNVNDTLTGAGVDLDLHSYANGLVIKKQTDSDYVCILSHGGSRENPPYSFYDITTKKILGGMYYAGDKLILSNLDDSGDLKDMLVIDDTAVTFGSRSSSFSPRIRTNNDPSEPESPSYTWYGNDQTGMYRPGPNVIGFSSDGVCKMEIADTGVTIESGLTIKSTSGGGTPYPPQDGYVLTATNPSGNAVWEPLPIPTHSADFVYQKVDSIASTDNTAQALCSKALKSDGKKYIIHVVAKVVASSNSGQTNSSNTGWIQQKLKIAGDIKDTAQFHLWIEDKKVKVWTTTLVCVYTAEITANGQVITSQGDQQNVYKNNWSSPTLSILYIPVN